MSLAHVRGVLAKGGLDPLLVGLVAASVYALHGYDGVLQRDLGVFTYGGVQVTRGSAPYVGIFNSVGPLADAVPGLAMWIGHGVGLGPVLAARLFFTALSAGCCALLCILARDTFGSRAAGLVAPAVFLTFEEFLELASDGPREKTTMVLLLVATLILLGRRRWVLAGVCTALATLTWQPVLAPAVVAAAVAVLVEERGRIRALVGFVAGGSLVTLVTVAVFALAGALRAAVGGFLIVNLLYTRQPSAFSSPGHTWRMMWADYHGSFLLCLVGLLAMLVLGAQAVPLLRRPTPAGGPVPRRLVITGAGAAAATAWTLAVVNGGPDLFVLLPFGALGVAGLVRLVAVHAPRRLGVLATAGVLVVGVGVGTAEALTSRSDALVQQRADIRAVLSTQPPSATVLSVDAPQVLVLAGRANPTPYQLFGVRMDDYVDHSVPGGMDALTRQLRALRPTFVAVGTDVRGTWPHRMLARDYWRVGSGTDWRWYLSRAAGPAALQRATAANRLAMAAGPTYSAHS